MVAGSVVVKHRLPVQPARVSMLVGGWVVVVWVHVCLCACG